MIFNISKEQITLALPKIQKPLSQYLKLQERFAKIHNPEHDLEFCKSFAGYYRVRRNAVWRGAYFTMMGELRDDPPDFRTCLARLFGATDRIEPSFTSKLLATIDPHRPVLDSVVLGHLGLRLPTWGSSQDRIEKAANIYDTLTRCMGAFVASNAGKLAVEAFRGYSPDFQKAQVTDTKIVDLVFWQTR